MISTQGKHREFLNFAKTQGVLFCSSSKFHDSKDTGYCDICHNIFDFSKSVLLMKLLKFLELTRGKFPVGQGICK